MAVEDARPGGTRPAASSKKHRTAAVIVLLIAVVLIGLSALMLCGVAGLVGTPGRFTSDRCRTVVHHNGTKTSYSTTCYGTLRSDGGRVLDHHASMGASVSPGTTLAVRELPTGLETLGLPAVTGWSTLLLGGAALAIIAAGQLGQAFGKDLVKGGVALTFLALALLFAADFLTYVIARATA